ncbi:hypothetical protein K0M31_017555 [Melipona bicolor]|uniref:Uncharacterized protein n=1 Tax=Melipona bicolor TaxID=60889 RepID=A0AA40G5A8_9HYME|nr:hypothetical protein K0M31_017555 [Melipona bicolor]
MISFSSSSDSNCQEIINRSLSCLKGWTIWREAIPASRAETKPGVPQVQLLPTNREILRTRVSNRQTLRFVELQEFRSERRTREGEESREAAR